MTTHRTSLFGVALGAALMMPLAMAQGTTSSGTPQTPPATSQPASPATAPAQAPATTTPSTQSPAPADPEATAGATSKPSVMSMSANPAQKSWNDIDTNKDGKISKTEAAADAGMKAIFTKADADGDGFLTADEYRTYYDKYQASAARKK